MENNKSNIIINKTTNEIKNASIYISDVIESPNNYTHEFDTIRNACPNTNINIYINSFGGNLWTGIQFIHAINSSNANIINGVIDGRCHSAASLIFLACDNYIVNPFASMLCHFYTKGMYGKGNEMIEEIEHDKKYFPSMVKSVYKGFLTNSELNNLIKGKDYWFDAKEIIKRLKNRRK